MTAASEITKGQFYHSLADSMSACMLPETEKALSIAVEALNPLMFPQDMSVEYGECDVRLSVGMSFRTVKHAYRDFRDSRGSNISPAVQYLLNCINTIPVSTTECKRGFSKMNVICCSLRSRLAVPDTSSLTFLSLCGPQSTCGSS